MALVVNPYLTSTFTNPNLNNDDDEDPKGHRKRRFSTGRDHYKEEVEIPDSEDERIDGEDRDMSDEEEEEEERLEFHPSRKNATCQVSCTSDTDKQSTTPLNVTLPSEQDLNLTLNLNKASIPVSTNSKSQLVDEPPEQNTAAVNPQQPNLPGSNATKIEEMERSKNDRHGNRPSGQTRYRLLR